MRTTHTIAPGNYEAYKAQLTAERLGNLDKATHYIIELCDNYVSALDCLKENGIKHRLDDTLPEDGMSILGDLADLRIEMESELSDYGIKTEMAERIARLK